MGVDTVGIEDGASVGSNEGTDEGATEVTGDADVGDDDGCSVGRCVLGITVQGAASPFVGDRVST